MQVGWHGTWERKCGHPAGLSEGWCRAGLGGHVCISLLEPMRPDPGDRGLCCRRFSHCLSTGRGQT